MIEQKRSRAGRAVILGIGLVIALRVTSKSFADGAPPASATQPAAQSPAMPPIGDLRSLIGVNPEGMKRVDVPQIPNMALRGFVQRHGADPIALIELTDLKQLVLVHKGTEIPITVTGHVTPAGHSELPGLDDASRVPGAADAVGGPPEQSQIILKVIEVTEDGVTVTAGIERQTIFVR
jgi:hypothetical protein